MKALQNSQDRIIHQLRAGRGFKYVGHYGDVSLRPVCVSKFPFLLEFCAGSSMDGKWLWIKEAQLRQLIMESRILRTLPRKRIPATE